MTRQINKFYFFILAFILIGCSEKNNTEDLSLEIQNLRKENDSIKQLLDSQCPKSRLNNDTILNGTTFLPHSSKMIGLINNGIEPIELKIIKECEVKDFDKDAFPKFIEIRRTSTTLIIDVEIIANACHNFLGEAEVVGTETLNLVYTEYGGFCSWGTCTLRFTFDTTLEKEYQVLKYVTINGSETKGVIPND